MKKQAKCSHWARWGSKTKRGTLRGTRVMGYVYFILSQTMCVWWLQCKLLRQIERLAHLLVQLWGRLDVIQAIEVRNSGLDRVEIVILHFLSFCYFISLFRPKSYLYKRELLCLRIQWCNFEAIWTSFKWVMLNKVPKWVNFRLGPIFQDGAPTQAWFQLGMA